MVTLSVFRAASVGVLFLAIPDTCYDAEGRLRSDLVRKYLLSLGIGVCSRVKEGKGDTLKRRVFPAMLRSAEQTEAALPEGSEVRWLPATRQPVRAVVSAYAAAKASGWADDAVSAQQKAVRELLALIPDQEGKLTLVFLPHPISAVNSDSTWSSESVKSGGGNRRKSSKSKLGLLDDAAEIGLDAVFDETDEEAANLFEELFGTI